MKKIRRKVRWNRLFLLILILIAIFYVIVFALNPPRTIIQNNIKKPKIKEFNVSLIMAGDVLIHGTVYNDAKISQNEYDFKPKVANIKKIVKNYDLAFYNQETIIGGKALGLSTYPMFNSPEEIGDAMVDAGFNLVSLANNHTLDRGEKAIINSLNYWSNQPVLTAGSYAGFEERNQPVIKKKNNISYTLLAYTTLTNGFNRPKDKDYYLNVYNEEQVKNDILRIRDKVDVLLVSMHWGTEYTHTPTDQQKMIANYLSSLGVDIIIGHHPHVLEPIEKIGNTLVIYSLGNLISSQIGEARLIGGMASVNINKKLIENEYKINISNPTVDLIYTYYNANRKNIMLYPFNQLNNDILPNYQTIYQKYANIVTGGNDFVMVSPI